MRGNCQKESVSVGVQKERLGARKTPGSKEIYLKGRVEDDGAWLKVLFLIARGDIKGGSYLSLLKSLDTIRLGYHTGRVLLSLHLKSC